VFGNEHRYFALGPAFDLRLKGRPQPRNDMAGLPIRQPLQSDS
jgi:hypothetical protein